jgi:hypothetical protein
VRAAHLDELDDRAIAHEISHLAGQLDPGWARSDDGDPLEGMTITPDPLHNLPEAMHVLQAPEADRVLQGTWYAESVRLASGGQNQMAVAAGSASLGTDLLMIEIDALHPVLEPPHAPTGQQVVITRGDFPGPELFAEELIEQWEEQEPVPRFNQENGGMVVLPAERKGRVQTRKPSPDDHDVVEWLLQRSEVSDGQRIGAAVMSPAQNANQGLLPGVMMQTW